MLTKHLVPPKTQRRFINNWDELDYLCRKIRYWLYKEKRKDKALHFVDRLEQILRKLAKNDGAILQEEGWALLYELKGEISKAIVHRRAEIDLMKQLHKEARSTQYSESTAAYMLRGRNTRDLEERKAVLKSLECSAK